MNSDPDNPTDTDRYQQLRDNGWQAGDPLPTCQAPRTAAQRRHDALARALRTHLDTGAAGLVGKHSPHLDITVSIDTLEGQPGAMPATGASGTSLPASLIRKLACDSAMTRYLLSLGRRVLEVSHTDRTLKAHERRALLLQAGYHCQVAGCHHDHTTGRLVPHHDLHSGHKILRLRDGRRLGPHGWVTDGAWGRTVRPDFGTAGAGLAWGHPARVWPFGPVVHSRGRCPQKWFQTCAPPPYGLSLVRAGRPPGVPHRLLAGAAPEVDPCVL